MTVLAAPTYYVDVAGTDRSSVVVSIPQVHGELSRVSKATLILDNHAAGLASAFTKHQVVSISAARAAFASLSDYFTGTDGAAADAAKWDTFTGGGTTAAISSNKIKLTTNASGNGPAILSDNSFTFPYTLTVYTYSTLNHAADWNTYVYGRRGSDNASWWALAAYNGEWHLLTYLGAAWAQRDVTAGTKYAVNTWYKIIIKRATATSIWVGVYDVFGTAIWETSTSTDTLTSEKVQMGNGASNSSGDTYFDSFLMWGASTPQGEQLFEGYIDKIAYNPSINQPNTITLLCSGYESELTDQYDDPYGTADTLFTPTYGATDDVTAHITALLPSGWTCKCPDTAIHDPQTVSIGTKRIDAINGFLNSTPYLGWFVIPPKCLCCVMPDTPASYGPDALTEATAGWTAYNHDVFAVEAVHEVDGTNCLQLGKNAAGTFGAYYDVSFSTATYGVIHFYYRAGGANFTSLTIKLWTDVGGGKCWSYSLPTNSASTVLTHFVRRMPDTTGAHGWTDTGGAGQAIQRIEFVAVGTGSLSVYWDVLYPVAVKKSTSKYTLSAPVYVSREESSENITKAIVIYTGGATLTVDDATAQAIDGLHEYLHSDYNITTLEDARGAGMGIMNAQAYGETSDPLIVEYLDPGDMYNVVLGDTLTITDSFSNLSSATRPLITRRDSITNQSGWITTLYLSAMYSEMITEKLLALAIRKRR